MGAILAGRAFDALMYPIASAFSTGNWKYNIQGYSVIVKHLFDNRI